MFELKRLFGGARLSVDRDGNGEAASDTIRVLAITRSAEDTGALRAIAAEAGWELGVLATSTAAARFLEGQPAHIVICDRDLPDEDWRTVMTTLAPNPQVACVLLASTVSDDYLWDEVIQCRGYDVVLKPFTGEQLRRTVKFAWSWRRWSVDGRDPVGVKSASRLRRKER